MTTAITKDTPRFNARANVVLGIPHSYLSLSYEHKLEKHSGRLRGHIKWVSYKLFLNYTLIQIFKIVLIGRAETFGAMIEYGLQRKISEHSALAVALSIGVPNGVYRVFSVWEREKKETTIEMNE